MWIMIFIWIIWNTQKNEQKTQKSGSLCHVSLAVPPCYGCCQQPAASNTWAFSAALAGTYCSNLVFMSKAHHVVRGPVYGGTIPRMVKLSTDHTKIKDLISTLRNLLRREAMVSGAWAVILKEQGFAIACLSFSVSSWSMIPHWNFYYHKQLQGFCRFAEVSRNLDPRNTHTSTGCSVCYRLQ